MWQYRRAEGFGVCGTTSLSGLCDISFSGCAAVCATCSVGGGKTVMLLLLLPPLFGFRQHMRRGAEKRAEGGGGAFRQSRSSAGRGSDWRHSQPATGSASVAGRRPNLISRSAHTVVDGCRRAAANRVIHAATLARTPWRGAKLAFAGGSPGRAAVFRRLSVPHTCAAQRAPLPPTWVEAHSQRRRRRRRGWRAASP